MRVEAASGAATFWRDSRGVTNSLQHQKYPYNQSTDTSNLEHWRLAEALADARKEHVQDVDNTRPFALFRVLSRPSVSSTAQLPMGANHRPNEFSVSTPTVRKGRNATRTKMFSRVPPNRTKWVQTEVDCKIQRSQCIHWVFGCLTAVRGRKPNRRCSQQALQRGQAHHSAFDLSTQEWEIVRAVMESTCNV